MVSIDSKHVKEIICMILLGFLILIYFNRPIQQSHTTDNIIVRIHPKFKGNTIEVISKFYPLPLLCDEMSKKFDVKNCGCTPICPSISTNYEFRDQPDIRYVTKYLDSLYQTKHIQSKYYVKQDVH